MLDLGILYFIKGNSVKIIPMTINEEDIDKRFNIYNGLYISNEEREAGLNNHLEFALREHARNGWSVVRYQKGYGVEQGNIAPRAEGLMNTFISPNITPLESEQLKKFVCLLSNNKIDSSCIYNYFYDGEFLNFDIYDEEQNFYNRRGEKFSNFQAIDFFIRQKHGQLNIEEQFMYNEYINFKLEDVLTKDYGHLPINHGNAAVILISKDDIIRENTRKYQHGAEFDYYLSRKYPDIIERRYTVWELADYTENILIQLSDKTFIAYIPEMNQYQKEELSSIISELATIQKRLEELGEPPITIGVEYRPTKEQIESLDDLIDFINNYPLKHL